MLHLHTFFRRHYSLQHATTNLLFSIEYVMSKIFSLAFLLWQADTHTHHALQNASRSPVFTPLLQTSFFLMLMLLFKIVNSGRPDTVKHNSGYVMKLIDRWVSVCVCISNYRLFLVNFNIKFLEFEDMLFQIVAQGYWKNISFPWIFPHEENLILENLINWKTLFCSMGTMNAAHYHFMFDL